MITPTIWYDEHKQTNITTKGEESCIIASLFTREKEINHVLQGFYVWEERDKSRPFGSRHVAYKHENEEIGTTRGG